MFQFILSMIYVFEIWSDQLTYLYFFYSNM